LISTPAYASREQTHIKTVPLLLDKEGPVSSLDIFGCKIITAELLPESCLLVKLTLYTRIPACLPARCPAGSFPHPRWAVVREVETSGWSRLAAGPGVFSGAWLYGSSVLPSRRRQLF